MKKLFLLITMMTFGTMVMAVHVPQQEARKIAVTVYASHQTGLSATPMVSNETVTTFNNVPTYYTFRFLGGGFVMVAADDASLPVLGYATDSELPLEITNPATKAWLEGYSREIYQVISHKLDNRVTLRAWEAIRQGNTDASPQDVSPLLATTWDQGCFYNALCPAATGAQCGHVWSFSFWLNVTVCLRGEGWPRMDRLRRHRHVADHEIPQLPAAGRRLAFLYEPHLRGAVGRFRINYV